MDKKTLRKILYHIAVAELTGLLSALLSRGFINTYGALIKPPLAPPGWLFGLVWPLLYALMGYSAYLIRESCDNEKYSALNLYKIQLFLNFLWPLLFFRWHLLWISAVELIVLIIFVYKTIIAFKNIDETASLLLLPYLLWLTFALYLNIGFAILN